jgi:hypothetical protein
VRSEAPHPRTVRPPGNGPCSPSRRVRERAHDPCVDTGYPMAMSVAEYTPGANRLNAVSYACSVPVRV